MNNNMASVAFFTRSRFLKINIRIKSFAQAITAAHTKMLNYTVKIDMAFTLKLISGVSCHQHEIIRY